MYNTCYECRSNILIYPDELHPDIITQSLNIIPTEKSVKNQYREGYKGRKYIIKNSTWFIMSEDYVESEDLMEHISWIMCKFNNIENLPCYLQERLKNMILSKNWSERNDKIVLKFSCIWNPVQDHGGPILSPKIMNAVAKVDVQFSIEPYFVYDISMVFSFMEAGRLLGVGQGLAYEDWMHLLAFIKIVHNVAPSTLGAIYDTGDFRDDDGNLICNIKDYIP